MNVEYYVYADYENNPSKDEDNRLGVDAKVRVLYSQRENGQIGKGTALKMLRNDFLVGSSPTSRTKFADIV